MHKKIVALLLGTLLSISVVGCGKSTDNSPKTTATSKQEQKQDKQEKNEEKKTNKAQETKSKLDGIKAAFKDAGFKVGDNETLAFQMLGAKNGYKFKLDEKPIEVYEYDMANLNDDAKKYVEQAKKGSIDFSGFNIPVKFKDGLMLVRYDEHSKKDKIIKIFNEYK